MGILALLALLLIPIVDRWRLMSTPPTISVLAVMAYILLRQGLPILFPRAD